jgi:glycosyltransferase involved in cell wall biosynthesis
MRIVLALLDVFVLPSLEEGLGLSIMGAMACGKAVIGSRIGGISDIIDHNVHGLLVPPADSVQLAQAIELLLSDINVRQRLQKAAVIRIRERFTSQEMIEKTEKVYLSCV